MSSSRGVGIFSDRTGVSVTQEDDSCINYNDILPLGTDDFTIMFWVRTEERRGHLFDLFGNRWQGSHGCFLSIRMAGQHQQGDFVSAEVDEDNSGKNYISVRAQKTCNDGKWHHISVSRFGPRLTLCVDGRPVGAHREDGGVADICSPQPLRLGRSLKGWHSIFAPDADFSDLRLLRYHVPPSRVLRICTAVRLEDLLLGALPQNSSSSIYRSFFVSSTREIHLLHTIVSFL